MEGKTLVKYRGRGGRGAVSGFAQWVKKRGARKVKPQGGFRGGGLLRRGRAGTKTRGGEPRAGM